MGYVLEFIIAFLLVMLYYYVFEFRKIKKPAKKGDPVELKLFLNMYNIDLKKVSRFSIMKKLSCMIAFDISVMLLITEVTSSFILKFVIAVPSVLFLLIGSYKLLGYYYKKKGLIKNES